MLFWVFSDSSRFYILKIMLILLGRTGLRQLIASLARAPFGVSAFCIKRGGF